VAWGDNSAGQTTVPAPNADFIAVAAGDYHSVGLKADESIVAWGSNWVGQTNIPEPNADFIAIAAGGNHSLGLKTNGSIVAWGENNYGQTIVQSLIRVSSPSPRARVIVWALRPTGPSWRGETTTGWV